MCGIAGAFVKQGGVVPIETVRRMGLTMPHRGPDNFGVKAQQRIAMSHNRLSLLDLSEAGNQPYSRDGFLLSYNGEIYNFKKLRNDLEKDHGVTFSSTSDTEVLFNSLIISGVEATLAAIRGMFAFSFYDPRDSTLILARDRMGIKPLYYYEDSDVFYWASEIKAISTSLGLSPDPVRTLFSVNNTAEKSTEFTLFKGVRSVMPGHYLNVDHGIEPRSVCYYDVVNEFDRDRYLDLSRQPKAAVQSEFEELLTQSVEGMLVSDAPVGAFVSGGIDSSLISAIATKCNADLKLFTANVVGKYSEFSDVQLLSKFLGKEVIAYDFFPEMMLRDWVDVTYFYECPIVIHVNSIPFSNVARLARDSGVKAVLTGEGADELFLGYPTLLTRRYEKLAALPVNAAKAFYKLSPKLFKFLFPESSDTPLAFINRMLQGFKLNTLDRQANEHLKWLAPRERREQILSINMIREHLVSLLHRNDRMGMMSSIEARFPFLDEDLVRFAINLPSKFKIGRSGRFHNYKHPFLIDKWVVRNTAGKYLPKELVNKKKNGFPMFGHKFVKIKEGFFDDGWVKNALGLRRDDREFSVDAQDPYFVAKLASVEIFGRIFGLGQSREEVKLHVASHTELIRS